MNGSDDRFTLSQVGQFFVASLWGFAKVRTSCLTNARTGEYRT